MNPATRERAMLWSETRSRGYNPAPGRQVFTAEGARKYGLPIGATILPGMRALTAAQLATVADLPPDQRARYLIARRDGATHGVAMKAARGATPAKVAKKAPAKKAPSAADDALKAEEKRVTRVFQRYTSEDMANKAAAHTQGPRQKQAVGEYHYTHPDVPGKAFSTRWQAAKAGLDASPASAKKATPSLTGEGGLSTDPAVRDVQIDNRIRAAYSAVLARKSNQDNRWVMLSDLRDELGESTNRHEIDDALKRMAISREPGSAHVVPEDNQKALLPKDREAAVHFGGTDKHAISIDDPSPRPLPTPAKKAPAKRAAPGAGQGIRSEQQIKAAYEMNDSETGISTSVEATQVNPASEDRPGWTKVFIGLDRDGERVGEAQREISPDGKTVFHTEIVLEDEFQGKGFGTRFSRRSLDEYRRSGVEKVQLKASEDVGGYAWARAGFDFATPNDRSKTADRARQWADRNDASRALRAEIERVASNPDATPADFAMIGHRSGDTTWPGKKIMLGSEWDGVMDLRPAPARKSTAAAKKAAPKKGSDLLGGGDSGGLASSILTTATERQTGEGKFGSIAGPHGDEMAFAIAQRQGFDGAPRVVSAKEFDRLVAAGHQPLYRGISKDEAGISGEEFGERIRTGDAYLPTGVWGSGIYTSRRLDVARRYGPNPLRMTLGPDARVADWRTLKDEHKAFLAGLDPDSDEHRVFSDMGRYAAARGFDAMRVEGSLEDEVLVFNRSALRFRDPSVKTAAAHEVPRPSTTDAPDLTGLTTRQKRARLKALGFTPEQIDELAPTAAAAARKAAPKAPAAASAIDAEDERLLRDVERLGFAQAGGVTTGRERQRTDRLDMLVRRGLLRRSGGYYLLTDTGREALGGSASPATRTPAPRTAFTDIAERISLLRDADSAFDELTVYQPGVLRRIAKELGIKIPVGVRDPDEIRRIIAAGVVNRPAMRSEDPDTEDVEFRDDEDPEDDEDLVDEEFDDTEDVEDEPEVLSPATRDRALALTTRALGHDITPGHDELHHYWVCGKGKAKWSTWTELVAHLTRHVGPRKAEIFASRWFHERYGFYAGSDLNRVKHGKPPRGDRIGPG